MSQLRLGSHLDLSYSRQEHQHGPQRAPGPVQLTILSRRVHMRHEELDELVIDLRV
jgi:hypothetical protein